MQVKPTRRRAALAILALIGLLALFVGRPLLHLATVMATDSDTRQPLPAGHFRDVSRLKEVPVREVWAIPSEPAEAEAQLAALLKRAAGERLSVSIAGSRHSMGGHTFTPGGLVIDMRPFNGMSLDETSDTLRVGAGARWDEVIPYLNARGRSVSVMQAFSSFTVGGSLSVNCHGWQPASPPISSSVVSFRLMGADGVIRRCSREENAELFSCALGGYGLFGVILDAELSVVPNEEYREKRRLLPVEELLAAYTSSIGEGSDVGLCCARLAVDKERFLREGILMTYHRVPSTAESSRPIRETANAWLNRAILRGSARSAYGKHLRWEAEMRLSERSTDAAMSRNELLNDNVVMYENRSDATTDVLQEYFIPRAKAAAFIGRMREVVPRHPCDLMNVTIRDLAEDKDTLLRYAREDVFALVLLLNIDRNAAGDAALKALERDLIDEAHKLGGTYYLPYRPGATREQFDAMYPQGAEFFRLKRKYDPEELFQSEFYRRYGVREEQQPARIAPQLQ